MWHWHVVDQYFIFAAEYNDDVTFASSDDLTECVSRSDNVAAGVANSLLLGQR